MARKLEDILNNIPDVIELKVDEKAVTSALKRSLIANGVSKAVAGQVAEKTAQDFIKRFADNLYERQVLTFDKAKIRRLFDLVMNEYLKLLKENEKPIDVEGEEDA